MSASRLVVYINKLESERASYNGSIEASQASDVGSIPIARSKKFRTLISLNGFTSSWPPNSRRRSRIPLRLYQGALFLIAFPTECLCRRLALRHAILVRPLCFCRDRHSHGWHSYLHDLRSTPKTNSTRAIGRLRGSGSRCPQIHNRPLHDQNTGTIPGRYHALAPRSLLNASPQSVMA